MPRTPPIFSKYEQIRERGARGIQYRPEEFGVSGEERWKAGEMFWKPGEKCEFVFKLKHSHNFPVQFQQITQVPRRTSA